MRFTLYIIVILLTVSRCQKLQNKKKTALYFEGIVDGESTAYFGNELNNSTVKDSAYFSSNFAGANSYDSFDDSVRLSYKWFVNDVISKEFQLQLSYSKYEDVNKLYNDSISKSIKYLNYNLFNTMLSAGKSSLLNGNFPKQNGFKIELYNKDGYWHSDNTSSSPQHSNYYNSNFTIEKIEPFYSTLNNEDSEAIRVFANFSVTLYNDNKDSIRIENAKCALVFTQ